MGAEEEVIAGMKGPAVASKLSNLSRETMDNDSHNREDSKPYAHIAIRCMERILVLSSQGGGGAVFANDQKTLPSIVAFMDRYSQDPELQLRGLMTMHKILARNGMADTIRTTGALRAILRALQYFTAHGVATLRAVFPAKGFSQQTVNAAIESIQAACDHSDPKQMEAWVGILPKGFLALPEPLREDKNFGEALSGKAWNPAKKKWVVPRGL